MRVKSSSNLNILILLLTFAVLGCVCGNSDQTSTTQKEIVANIQRIGTQAATPSPSPSSNSSSPTLNLPKEEKPQVIGRITKGKAIYNRISSSTGLPIMFGWQAKDITVMIPSKEWNRLSNTQKVDLTYFMDTLAEVISETPESYVSRWTAYYRRTEQLERGGEFDGLSREGYIRNASSICSSCWSISTGTNKADGFYDDDYPVKGSDADSFRASSDSTKK